MEPISTGSDRCAGRHHSSSGGVELAGYNDNAEYYSLEEEEEEEEEEVIIDEAEMLRMLDKMEPPLSVCQRLLKIPPTIPECGEEDGDSCHGGGNEEPSVDSWRVLTAAQRQSLSQRGFVVLNGLASVEIAAQAYEEALARASEGKLKPAHGGTGDGDKVEGAEAGVTGYVKSVRDDLTTFISSEGEEDAGIGSSAGAGGIKQALEVLAGLGEDLGRLVRLKGRVEHQRLSFIQLAVYPAGMNARYERHRDAYPDDGADSEDDFEQGSGFSDAASNTERGLQGGDLSEAQEEVGDASASAMEKNDSSDWSKMEEEHSESVSFRRITAICYLRDSNSSWTGADGGALRLYPPVATTTSDAERVKTKGGSVSWTNGTDTNNAHGFVETEHSGATFALDNEHGSSSRHMAFGQEETICAGVQQRRVIHDDDRVNTADVDVAPFSGSSFNVDNIEDSTTTDGQKLGGGHGQDSDTSVSIEAQQVEISPPKDGRRSTGNIDGVGSEQEGLFIDVAPLAGRAVVFFSGAIEHEVLPVTGILPRVALTTWFH